jgi:hypothetical protein
MELPEDPDDQKNEVVETAIQGIFNYFLQLIFCTDFVEGTKDSIPSPQTSRRFTIGSFFPRLSNICRTTKIN